MRRDLRPAHPAGDAAGDGRAWCLTLPERAGVVAIPASAFYAGPTAGRTLVRFAFCKRPAVIDAAVARLVAARDAIRMER